MADMHGADTPEGGLSLVVGLAKGISLAAAPIFAFMALLACWSGSPVDGMCLPGALSPMGAMVPMYLLMSFFHGASWLQLLLARPVARKSESPPVQGDQTFPQWPDEFRRARRFLK